MLIWQEMILKSWTISSRYFVISNRKMDDAENQHILMNLFLLTPPI